MGVAEVRDYWQAEPCAAKLSRHEPGEAAFFRDIEEAKSRMEPHEARFAEFERWAGRDVLEIGCGLGIDTARFARAGANVTAIDLTDAGVALTHRLLDLEQLAGEAMVANAERLPFADERFDLVYSWGVLHHTPNIRAAVDEVRRVLRPGGEARVMLYSRHSLFSTAVWLRQMAREVRPMSLRSAIARGLESPGTQAFTKLDAYWMFAQFATRDIRQVATVYDRLPVDRLGWHLLIRAQTAAR